MRIEINTHQTDRYQSVEFHHFHFEFFRKLWTFKLHWIFPNENSFKELNFIEQPRLCSVMVEWRNSSNWWLNWENVPAFIARLFQYHERFELKMRKVLWVLSAYQANFTWIFNTTKKIFWQMMSSHHKTRLWNQYS